ncbi:DUF2332 domain-containing protein [Paenibacillus sp. R14(2021)]|uniref:DUF2332 domain-containing protein n=1 Tax=Paenibacillus sp. R14(2021) TaxID=2859228 RepID=UPI001C615390|nr:DUF2332 domain-containing protein [Paenibacillus sp. R14(2021)]
MHALAASFKRFASLECRDSSSLYEQLSLRIAEDEQLLTIAANAGSGQPVPNLFLGAVHYLLMKGNAHPLRSYYASLVDDPQSLETAFAAFRSFCLSHEQELIHLLRTKLVQTNEVRRCAYLYPAFCLVYRQSPKPLVLVEIGTSAGLQLLWDQYGYSYEKDGRIYGNKLSELQLSSFIRSGNPMLLEHSPPVAARIGIDLHVNDMNCTEDYVWLKALIWPEHRERAANFDKAVSELLRHRLSLHEGDGIETLVEIARAIPVDQTLCIFHTHAANQFSQEAKLMLTRHLREIGRSREVYHLYNNMQDRLLHLDSYAFGTEHELTLAETDGHGRWFSWLL